MSSDQITARVAKIEAELIKPVAEMWAALNAKIYACPERENDAPHVPQFSPDLDMHCVHCGVDLVAL